MAEKTKRAGEPMAKQGWEKIVQDSTIERRNNGRCSFIAIAELVDLHSNSQLSARTTDLDRGGCYIDTINPLGVGTPVALQLQKDNQSFRARAEVVYVQQGNGMGLAFARAEAAQSQILEQWIAALGATTSPNSASDAVELSAQKALSYQSNPDDREDAGPFGRLIVMLVQKNMLTEAEGRTLLGKTRF